MPSFNIVKKSSVNTSYRVERILSDFDMSKEKGELHIQGNIDIPENWNVGLIYGGSGTGKTTMIKELFPEAIIEDFSWGENSFIDDFDKNIPFDQISKTLYAVGLGSVPSWLRPFKVLSNGEKMRVTLARGLLERDFFVFDEFTSVVDRQVAKVCSLAISRYCKKNKKKFLAVSCHKDVIEWLEPDWAFCTDEMKQNFRFAHTQEQNLRLESVGGTNGTDLAVITI